MNSVKILHAADLHLDSPFEGLSAEQAALRRAEQRELLEKIVELARDEEAQLLLLAGDLLDSASAYSETAELLRVALGRIDIPVFIAPGNHDFYARRSPYARLRLPPHVHIFPTPALACVPLPALGVRVWGAGYQETACPPLLRGFELQKDGDTLDILVLHAEVDGRGDSPYCPVTREQLKRSGFDYAAFGHVHSFSGLCRAGDCFYAWPGCPEGRGFDECGEKGVIALSLAPGTCDLRFVPLGTRRYERLELPAGEDALATILAALPPDTGRDIYRIILTGECETAPPMQSLEQALAGRFFALGLRDRTTPRRDIWEDSAEDRSEEHTSELQS